MWISSRYHSNTYLNLNANVNSNANSNANLSLTYRSITFGDFHFRVKGGKGFDFVGRIGFVLFFPPPFGGFFCLLVLACGKERKGMS